MARTRIDWIAVLAAAFVATAASARDPLIDNVRFGASADNTRVVVESDQAIEPFIFSLAEFSPRVVLEIDRAEFNVASERLANGQQAAAGAGLVERYRYAQFSPTRSRIVFDLTGPARIVRHFALEPAPGAQAHRYVIDLASTDQASFEAQAGFASERAAASRRTAASSARQAERSIVIVLDPGHGGRDRGASSAAGTLEKDVNLQLAREIRAELEASARYRVVMTREGDQFIGLPDRVRIAREAGADLFLSIHADSGPSDPRVHGASVYTLSEGAEARAREEILRDDPWLVDVSLEGRTSEVGDIIVDLVHRVTRNESLAFAETLIPYLDEVGPLLNNTHRRRGFFVLLAPDVPAVLLEAGFLTNREDELRLTSPRERARLAEAVASGIDAYFDRRERL